MISGLYTKKISIKVDFLANIFGKINFYVYFAAELENDMERNLLIEKVIVVTCTELLGELSFTINDE